MEEEWEKFELSKGKQKFVGMISWVCVSRLCLA